MLSATSPIKNPQGRIVDALEYLSRYNYRKEFGLSYREFIEEPLDEFFINNEIMSVISDLQAREKKKLERSSKK